MKNILSRQHQLVILMLLLFSCGNEPQNSIIAGSIRGKEVLAAAKSMPGKVVLLNMWATWCDPCVEEFPDMVMLYEKYKDKGLKVITVSFDLDFNAAEKFLTGQTTEFINYIKDEDQDEGEFIMDLDPEWLGALPATWLFDKEGNKKYFHMEQFFTEELEKKIVELLGRN